MKTPRNLNTTVSYVLRGVVILHIGILGLSELRMRLTGKGVNLPGEYGGILLLAGPPALVLLLLVLDWLTHRDPKRRYAKLIDSVLGIGWAAYILYSLSTVVI